MFRSIKKSGTSVDYIVNNAGVSGPVTCFPNASMDDFAGTVAIHLTGTFWVSVCGLSCMERGGKIITISTFFTEERPLEQRPYRFRGPYTASQGAKNRLAEAMSWELVGDGIASIATNPGPVHSDRIYKTVYPKAAAEFMRVSGFEALDPAHVEAACADILSLLGEDEDTVRQGLDLVAAKMTGVDGRAGRAGAAARKDTKHSRKGAAQYLAHDSRQAVPLSGAGGRHGLGVVRRYHVGHSERQGHTW